MFAYSPPGRWKRDESGCAQNTKEMMMMGGKISFLPRSSDDGNRLETQVNFSSLFVIICRSGKPSVVAQKNVNEFQLI